MFLVLNAQVQPLFQGAVPEAQLRPLFQQLLETLRDIGARRNADIGAVAMRWALDQPGVAAIIVGVRHDNATNQAR